MQNLSKRQVKIGIFKLYSILLIKNRQRKLVKADKTINHCNPNFGSKKAPERLLVIRARLLTLQSKANDVASKPGRVLRAIKSMTIKKMNIPISVIRRSILTRGYLK